jgi:ABC-type Fe3+/spermidine/putrescine transport system ATPase subunit
MAVIEVHHLIKGFDRVAAIDGVSFVVDEREILVILGESGCGKTTTLRCIAGLETPTSGSIKIEGRTVVDGAICSARKTWRRNGVPILRFVAAQDGL